jgi:UDP-glucose 4-epimerase
MDVLVTGAAGYIGSRVVALLQDEHPDWDVTALDNFYLGDVRQVGEVTVEHVDIRHRDELRDALSGADVVLHLAAVSGVDDCEDNPDLAYEVNVQGTNNVAWFCRRTGAGLAFPFSMAVLGDPSEFPITVEHPRDPMNWYGRTKLLGERAIDGFADSGFPAALFMISNLYGEHSVNDRRVSKNTVINFFVERALAGETLTVYEPGTQSRNFVHVDDVAVPRGTRLPATRTRASNGSPESSGTRPPTSRAWTPLSNSSRTRERARRRWSASSRSTRPGRATTWAGRPNAPSNRVSEACSSGVPGETCACGCSPLAVGERLRRDGSRSDCCDSFPAGVTIRGVRTVGQNSSQFWYRTFVRQYQDRFEDRGRSLPSIFAPA